MFSYILVDFLQKCSYNCDFPEIALVCINQDSHKLVYYIYICNICCATSFHPNDSSLVPCRCLKLCNQ
uniref:Uncharacterized protein n=1 Tax=Octopus bimaculoides TaxID=37653 RepID=A0A0L8GJM4_OCTBM